MTKIRTHRPMPTSTSTGEELEKESVFRPSRLTLARQRRGMSKTDLAAASGLSPNSISSYEKGKRSPAEQSAARLADATRFPLRFFFATEAELVAPEAVSFRALSKMAARKRDIVTATAALATQLDAWITARYTRPDVHVPDLSGLGPAGAAEALRAEWGLGSEPIHHVVHLLESRGVRVYSLAVTASGLNLDEVFGLSMWWNGLPFVFVNMEVTAERARSSLLHELGHLTLHRDEKTDSSLAETEANTFAGHMSVPSSRIRAEANRYDSFEDIVAAKKGWRTSALLYVYRMHEEDVLDEWRYRELCVRLRRDYGKNEPDPMSEYESSRLLRQVFDDLRADGGRELVANELQIPLSVLDDIVFMHTLTPTSGGLLGASSLKLVD